MGAVKHFCLHWVTACATLHNMHHSTLNCLWGPHSQTYFPKKVFFASGDKPSTDFGSGFKCFSLDRGVVHLDAEHQRQIVVFLQAWHVHPITFPLTSFMGRDYFFLVGFLHILQVSTHEDIVYNLWGSAGTSFLFFFFFNSSQRSNPQ